MATKVPLKTGSNIPPVDDGVHNAVCTGIWILGTFHDERFGKDSKKVIFQWELPELDPLEFVDQETQQVIRKPRGMIREFTFSMHKKGNLRPMLEGWAGKAMPDNVADGYDIGKCLALQCMLQVIHEENSQGEIKARIRSVMRYTGKQRLQASTKPFLFDIDELKSPILPDELPDWVKDRIKKSQEYAAILESAPKQMPSNRELGVSGQRPAQQSQQRPPVRQQQPTPEPEPDPAGGFGEASDDSSPF